MKDKIQRAGIYVSSLAVDGNHIDPALGRRAKRNDYAAKCIELYGKMGIPNIGAQSGTIRGESLSQQVDEIVKVYTEKYFPLCQRYEVRVLWELYAGGPNIAAGPCEGIESPGGALPGPRPPTIVQTLQRQSAKFSVT